MNETKTPGVVPPEITYQVMPHKGATAQAAPMPPQLNQPPQRGGKSSKLAYIVIAIIVLLVLGGVAYYFLGYNKKGGSSAQNSNSKLTAAFLQDNFGSATCADETVCGDNADPDNDGLSNYLEFVNNTKAQIADTDNDGLSDGDEVNVYLTLPNNPVTDTRAIAIQNNYTDGISIKNGYDPLTPGSKYSETALAQISARIAQFKLHAPTTTTLGLNPDGSKASSTDTSINPEAGGTVPTGTSGTPDPTR